jgi:hypothetical protein
VLRLFRWQRIDATVSVLDESASLDYRLDAVPDRSKLDAIKQTGCRIPISAPSRSSEDLADRRCFLHEAVTPQPLRRTPVGRDTTPSESPDRGHALT